MVAPTESEPSYYDYFGPDNKWNKPPLFDWNLLTAAREKLLVTAPQKRNYIVHLCELIGWDSGHCHTNADVFYLISAPLAAHAEALCAALKI